MDRAGRARFRGNAGVFFLWGGAGLFSLCRRPGKYYSIVPVLFPIWAHLLGFRGVTDGRRNGADWVRN